MDENTPIRQLGELSAGQLRDILLGPSIATAIIGSVGFAVFGPFLRRWRLSVELLLVSMALLALPLIVVGTVTDGTVGQIVSAVVKLWIEIFPKALFIFSVFAFIFRVLVEDLARMIAELSDRLGPAKTMWVAIAVLLLSYAYSILHGP